MSQKYSSGLFAQSPNRSPKPEKSLGLKSSRARGLEFSLDSPVKARSFFDPTIIGV
ncbi:MAG: hypothetical protein LBT86_05880 [Deltaproteobacteria bacterium]|nr:hypothetical protein [Deltaproteobacteria bacterium]